MNRHQLLPAVGALLALNGFAFSFTEYAWLAPWIGLAGVMAAGSGFGRAASMPKFWLMILASLFFAASCAAVLGPWLGWGLGLALLGHFLRMPFILSWGVNKYWWAEPLLCWSGLGLAVAGAL